MNRMVLTLLIVGIAMKVHGTEVEERRSFMGNRQPLASLSNFPDTSKLEKLYPNSRFHIRAGVQESFEEGVEEGLEKGREESLSLLFL